MINAEQAKERTLKSREEAKKNRTDGIFIDIKNASAAGMFYVSEFINKDHSYNHIMEKLKEYGFKVENDPYGKGYYLISWGDY